MSSIII